MLARKNGARKSSTEARILDLKTVLTQPGNNFNVLFIHQYVLKTALEV